MKKVLVLGANGFIGCHIVNELVGHKFEVRAFDRFFKGEEIKFKESKQVEIFKGDFSSKTNVRKALQGVDFVIHMISTTNPVISNNNPTLDVDTNIKHSIQLFELCSEMKIKRVIFASSGGTVYGENNLGRPFRETDPTWPVSPYGIGKLAIENYLHYFDKVHGLKYTVFRIANPYGDGQSLTKKQGVIPIFMNSISQNNPVTVLGDGSMVRDYVYVKDVAKIIVESLGKNLKHSVYNLGSGSGSSVNEIICEIEKVFGKKIQKNFAEVPETFVHTSVLDSSRLFGEFGEDTLTSLKDGVKYTYKSLFGGKDGEEE